MEGVSPLGGDLTHVHHCLRVVSIDVEDRGVHDARHVRAVGGGASQARVCGEPDLQGGGGGGGC